MIACAVCDRPLRDHKVTEPCAGSAKYQAATGRAKPLPSRRREQGKELQIMSSSNGKAWHVRAAADLGIKAEQPCRTCKGTGKVEQKISASTVIKTIFGLSQKSAISVGGSAVAGRIHNIKLEDLRRVSQMLGTDLDGAAAWLDRVAQEVSA